MPAGGWIAVFAGMTGLWFTLTHRGRGDFQYAAAGLTGVGRVGIIERRFYYVRALPRVA